MLTRWKFKLISFDWCHIVKRLITTHTGSIVLVIHGTVRVDYFWGSVVALLRHHGLRIVHMALLNLSELLLLMRHYVHEAVKLLLHLFESIHWVILCRLLLFLGWLLWLVILSTTLINLKLLWRHLLLTDWLDRRVIRGVHVEATRLGVTGYLTSAHNVRGRVMIVGAAG